MAVVHKEISKLIGRRMFMTKYFGDNFMGSITRDSYRADPALARRRDYRRNRVVIGVFYGSLHP
jgi:hypothetical protein